MDYQGHSAAYFVCDLSPVVGVERMEGMSVDRNVVHNALLSVGGPTTVDTLREMVGLEPAEFNRMFVSETRGIWLASIVDCGRSVLYASPMPFRFVTDSTGRMRPVRSIPKR